MDVFFVGNVAVPNDITIAVQGDNLTTSLRFILDKIQGDIDLSDGWSRFLCIVNKAGDFADKKADCGFAVNDDKVELTFCIPRCVTMCGQVDMQVRFEKSVEGADEPLVWQTQAFSTKFDRSLDVSKVIEKEYPDIILDLTQRTQKAESIALSVEQRADNGEFESGGVNVWRCTSENGMHDEGNPWCNFDDIADFDENKAKAGDIIIDAVGTVLEIVTIGEGGQKNCRCKKIGCGSAELSRKIGDFEAALDELHDYAEALKGGEA